MQLSLSTIKLHLKMAIRLLKLQRVYIKGHRCIQFPEVNTTNKKTNTISFTSLHIYYVSKYL
ncbi:hypothetical protein IUY40_08745 [Flavobacterium sp. ALJ2]|uniref:hypothetical protein n=1 Tax=Flavobacterium sp. ALJ2 TaxID=2786960 RepID=UPI00189F6826|nr:hypothetical protein [Flavobacterium sp. ALJ2]MBF7091627.1 hypothetical protein [Flavobacterium sp. ALJ2]